MYAINSTNAYGWNCTNASNDTSLFFLVSGMTTSYATSVRQWT